MIGNEFIRTLVRRGYELENHNEAKAVLKIKRILELLQVENDALRELKQYEIESELIIITDVFTD